MIAEISHKRISRPLDEEQDQIHHGPEQSAANSTQLLPYFRIHPQIQVEWILQEFYSQYAGT